MCCFLLSIIRAILECDCDVELFGIESYSTADSPVEFGLDQFAQNVGSGSNQQVQFERHWQQCRPCWAADTRSTPIQWNFIAYYWYTDRSLALPWLIKFLNLKRPHIRDLKMTMHTRCLCKCLRFRTQLWFGSRIDPGVLGRHGPRKMCRYCEMWISLWNSRRSYRCPHQ